MGVISAQSSGFNTPAEVYDAMTQEEEVMTAEQEARIRAEIEAYIKAQQQAQQASSSTARSDLDEAHIQSLPSGVEIYRMATGESGDEMPPLVDIEEGEEEEDLEDDPELIQADDDDATKTPAQPRKHKETIDYSTKLTKWQDKSVQEDDIRFQLFLRGIELAPEQEEEIAKLKIKEKGRNQTRKDYLINYVDRLLQKGKWTDQVNDQLLQKRMGEWREMKKGKGKSSSSSGGIGGAIASGAKAVGGAVLDAGKEVAKDALISGAKFNLNNYINVKTTPNILKETMTHRLKILPERQKRTQQGILLDDIDFDDFDLSKYDRKEILMNKPEKGTQTDIFESKTSTEKSESMKSIEKEYTQGEEAENEPTQDKEPEREEPQRERGKSMLRSLYDNLFGEDDASASSRQSLDEFGEEREEMRNRREQIEEEEKAQIEVSRSISSDEYLPMNVKKSYEPSSSSSSSSSRRSSTSRSALLPIEEEALSEFVQSSPPISVQSSSPSNRTIEYVEESPVQSVLSSRRSQETIEYIRSRSSRGSVQSISS